MNEELKNKLNEFLGKLIEGMEKAGDFAVDQIPDVVQQALTWFALKSGVLFAIGLLFTLLSIPLVRYGLKNLYERNSEGEIKRWLIDDSPRMNDSAGYCFVAAAAVLVVGVFYLSFNLEWLQILVAPKWFIVSEMSKLI